MTKLKEKKIYPIRYVTPHFSDWRSAASHRYRNPAENHSYENTSAVRRLFVRT